MLFSLDGRISPPRCLRCTRARSFATLSLSAIGHDAVKEELGSADRVAKRIGEAMKFSTRARPARRGRIFLVAERVVIQQPLCFGIRSQQHLKAAVEPKALHQIRAHSPAWPRRRPPAGSPEAGGFE